MKLREKTYYEQPETGFVCMLVSCDTPDPMNPNLSAEDGTYVWSLIMIDERAPVAERGNYVVHNLTPDDMVAKLDNEDWIPY